MPRNRAHARTCLLLFGASLLLRVAILWPVVHLDVQPLFDEADYLARAVAWRDLLTADETDHAARASAWTTAYGEGRWPPLHPLLIAVGLLWPGAGLGAARLMVTLVSAATTPLVYLLTRRVASVPAARAAGVAHLVYPGFLAYSHYLWSESTYIFFVLAAALATLRAEASASRRGQLLFAALAGIYLGAAALTRAAALPFIVVVPLWLAYRLRARRASPAGAVVLLLASIIVIAPWVRVLHAEESRFVPLSTMTGYNLALGNNPWVPRGYGSCWGLEPCKARLMSALEARAERVGGDWKSSAAGVALQDIRSSPGRFLVRSAERARMLWAPDFFPIRHLWWGLYPGVTNTWALLLSIVIVGAYLVLVLAGLTGLLGASIRPNGIEPLQPALLLLLVGVATIPCLVSFGISRLHQPMLALLLPAVGHGLVLARHGCWPPRRRLAIAVAAFLLVSLSAMPLVVEGYLAR